MSRMADLEIQNIENLAKASGYDEGFLVDVWHDICANGDPDWQYFVDVILERDW